MNLLLAWVIVLMQAQAGGQVRSVQGIVTRDGSSDPIANARILVIPVDGVDSPVTLARTDREGRFLVPGLPAGRYRIIVERDGYVRAVSMATIESASVTTTAIGLTPTGVITGRVADAQGNPVSRAFVRAVSGKVSYEGQTNDLGEYRIFDLAPGKYVVNAAPYLAPRIEGTMLIRPTPPSPYAPGEGQAMLPLMRMLQAGDYIDPIALRREVYVPVYFPGTSDAAEATALDLKAGATLDRHRHDRRPRACTPCAGTLTRRPAT